MLLPLATPILVTNVDYHAQYLIESFDGRGLRVSSKLDIWVSDELRNDLLFGQFGEHVDVLGDGLVEVALSAVQDGARVENALLLADGEAIFDREVVSAHVAHRELLILSLAQDLGQFDDQLLELVLVFDASRSGRVLSRVEGLHSVLLENLFFVHLQHCVYKSER